MKRRQIMFKKEDAGKMMDGLSKFLKVMSSRALSNKRVNSGKIEIKKNNKK